MSPVACRSLGRYDCCKTVSRTSRLGRHSMVVNPASRTTDGVIFRVINQSCTWKYFLLCFSVVQIIQQTGGRVHPQRIQHHSRATQDRCTTILSFEYVAISKRERARYLYLYRYYYDWYTDIHHPGSSVESLPNKWFLQEKKNDIYIVIIVVFFVEAAFGVLLYHFQRISRQNTA